MLRSGTELEDQKSQRDKELNTYMYPIYRRLYKKDIQFVTSISNPLDFSENECKLYNYLGQNKER